MPSVAHSVLPKRIFITLRFIASPCERARNSYARVLRWLPRLVFCSRTGGTTREALICVIVREPRRVLWLDGGKPVGVTSNVAGLWEIRYLVLSAHIQRKVGYRTQRQLKKIPSHNVWWEFVAGYMPWLCDLLLGYECKTYKGALWWMCPITLVI